MAGFRWSPTPTPATGHHQFAVMIDLPVSGHTALAVALSADPAAPIPPQTTSPQVAVVFDAGQNLLANLAHLAQAELGFVGIVDPDRFAGLTALADRRQIFGAHRDHPHPGPPRRDLRATPLGIPDLGHRNPTINLGPEHRSR
jgi:hypothetical protein